MREQHTNIHTLYFPLLNVPFFTFLGILLHIFLSHIRYHKSKYVAGTCALQCCSDMKYGVKEWGSVQGVQPLIGCLENKDKFYCHPEVDQVYEETINYISTL